MAAGAPGRPRQLVFALRIAGVMAMSVGAVACGTSEQQRARVQEQRGALGEGVAARVGDENILASSVQHVADEQKVSPKEARAKLVSDALFAAGARERGIDSTTLVTVELRALLARRLVEGVRQQQYEADITDDEVKRFTALHWLDLDRPVARTSVHALVMWKDASDADERKRAAEVAARVAQALAGERDPAKFEERAKALPGEGFQIVVEKLPPITADGRLADLKERPPPGVPTPTFDPGYVKGLFEVAAPGDQRGSVASAYGYHLIMLTGVQPEHRVPFEERRKQLSSEAKAARAKDAMDALTASLRKQETVDVARNAGTLFELLPSGRADGP